jgi:transposase
MLSARVHLVAQSVTLVVRRAKGGRFEDLVRTAIADQPTTVVAIIERTSSSPDMSALFEDPDRFKRSSSVGAYLGLTPRRYQSATWIRQDESPAAGMACCGAICLRRPTFCSAARRALAG